MVQLANSDFDLAGILTIIIAETCTLIADVKANLPYKCELRRSFFYLFAFEVYFM